MNLKNTCIALLPAALLLGCGPQPQAPAGTAPPASTPAGAPAPRAEAAGVASRDFGDYVLHFNAISTDQLTPEVARSYDIVRSKNRALLNVSLVRKVEGTIGQPVPARVTALVVNDTGQVKDSNLREIRDGGAYYYIADFAVSNAETLVFTVDAAPADAATTAPFNVRFSRTFYSE